MWQIVEIKAPDPNNNNFGSTVDKAKEKMNIREVII